MNAVVKDSHVLGTYLLGRHVQGRIDRAVQLPGYALEKAFHLAVLAKRLGLDAKHVFLAGKDDTILFVGFGELASSGIDERTGRIVDQVEVGGGKALQRAGIGHGDLDGIHQDAVVPHLGANFNLLHLGRRSGAAGCHQQRGPKYP